MIDDEHGAPIASRALTPDHPRAARHGAEPRRVLPGPRGVQPVLRRRARHRRRVMDRFAKLTGRQYNLFDYVGAPDAERVIVMMGSAPSRAEECVELPGAQGEKVGVIKVRLYRPFAAEPSSPPCPRRSRGDRRARPHQGAGRHGEPLYLDVSPRWPRPGATACQRMPRSSAAATGCRPRSSRPAMVKAVFDELPRTNPRTTSPSASTTT
jgi:pyruvate-ferredoxin/flavodoxin oxidoreductase